MADKQEEVLLSEFSDDAATEADAESQMSLNINPPGEGTTWDKKARQHSYYVADGSINSSTDLSKKTSRSRAGKVNCSKVNGYALCEFMILGTAVIIIIGLFSIPTIYYSIPIAEEEVISNRSNTMEDSNRCLQGTDPYSGEVCEVELENLQTCYSGSSSPLAIPSTVNQQESEADMLRITLGLQFLRPSPECERRIIPFFCRHKFGMCDSNGDYHGTLRDECKELRDRVCVDEWLQAKAFLPAGSLPECELQADITDECISANITTTLSENTLTTLPTLTTNETTGNDSAIMCSEGFFYDQDNTRLCRPECGEFNKLPQFEIILQQVCTFIGFITAVIVLILAFTIQRDKLLTFPSTLLIYLCIMSIIFYIILIAGFYKNTELFCSSRDMIYAIAPGNQTVLCTISGIAFVYTLENICVWIMLHASFLFWGVAFPFHYRQMKVSKRLKYAHVISVVLAVIIPLPGALVPLKDGFVVTSYPALACAVRNTDVTFYTLIVPLSIFLAITAILLVFMFWKIFKDFVLKKLKAGKKVGKVGKAQIKISFIIIYYVLLGVLGLVTLTYIEVKSSLIGIAAVADFLVCESLGGSNCYLDKELIAVFESLGITVKILLMMIPVVVLIFVVDIQAIKNLLCKKRLDRSSSVKTKSSVVS